MHRKNKLFEWLKILAVVEELFRIFSELPNCGKGSPCGEVCIPRNHRCLQKLYENTSDNLDNYASLLYSGGSDEDKNLKKQGILAAVNNIGQKLFSNMPNDDDGGDSKNVIRKLIEESELDSDNMTGEEIAFLVNAYTLVKAEKYGDGASKLLQNMAEAINDINEVLPQKSQISNRNQTASNNFFKALNLFGIVELNEEEINRVKEQVSKKVISQKQSQAKISKTIDGVTNLISPKNTNLKLVELPETYSAEIREYAEKLQITLANNGVTLTQKEVISKAKAIDQYIKKNGEEAVNQFFKASLALLGSTGVRQLSSTLQAKEVEKLKQPKIQKKLLDGFEDQTKLIGGKYVITKEGQTKPEFVAFKDQSAAVIKYNDEEMPLLADDNFIKFFILVSPKSFQNALSKAGKPSGKAFAGYDKDGNRLNKGNGSTDARKIVLARQWIRQRGQCAYTGLQLSFANADLEHIKPLGKNGNDAEDPNNFVWIRMAVNQTKNEFDMSYLFDGQDSGGSNKASFSGVNKIDDLNAQEEKYLEAEDKAIKKKAAKNQIAENSKEIIEHIGQSTAGYEAKALLIAAYRGRTKKENQLEHVARILGDDIISKVEEGSPKPMNFRRELPWRGSGETNRTGAKHIGSLNAVFDFGKVSGTMSIAEWLLWNFTELELNNQIDIMNIYEEVLQSWATDPDYKVPSKVIPQMLVEKLREYFEANKLL